MSTIREFTNPRNDAEHAAMMRDDDRGLFSCAVGIWASLVIFCFLMGADVGFWWSAGIALFSVVPICIGTYHQLSKEGNANG